MEKRDIEKLAVYSIESEAEMIPFTQFHQLYIEKTSEIIYITKEGSLYGIVCMGEALAAHKQNGLVRINKSFTLLEDKNVMKAHEIFRDRGNINKIPIVDEQGRLVGDYSRWDDMLYSARNHSLFMKELAVKKILADYEAIYVIEPVEKKHIMYLSLIKYFNCFEIEYEIISKEQLGERLTEKAVCIFLNEDERRGMQCLYGLMPSVQNGTIQYDIPADSAYKVRMITFKTLLVQLMEEDRLERLKIERQMFYDQIDDKATVLLTELRQRGIQCFCLYEYEKEPTEYREKFRNEVKKRLEESPLDIVERMWTNGDKRAEFYDELYQVDSYNRGIAQKELNNAGMTFERKKNIVGKYFNAKNGRRITCFQPDDYIGTIYMLGPCLILGVVAEDQHTIESYLQKKLLEKGYRYRVENYGSMLRSDACIDSRLEEMGVNNKNDIVVYLSRTGEAVGIPGISLEKIFETYQIPSKWVTDTYIHCNYRVHQLIADSLFKLLKPYLKDEMLYKNNEKIKLDIHAVMKKYVKHKYLELYFSNFNGADFHSVGAIVMNCNPFSKGHRYLIEKAMKQVEFLIIFVVEEDKSVFPFDERYTLVLEGTKDLTNVMVVPSGEFILSHNNFFEYFSKQEDEIVVINAEYDINVFADYIAEPLQITHRFAGEELEDRVTAIYNETMSRVLPQKGIAFVEIPRIMEEDVIVSASRVRAYLKDDMCDKAFALLPESTIRYLKQQM